MACLAILSLAPVGASADGLDPARVGWTELSFEARKFIFSLETDLAVDLVPVADLAPNWTDSTAGDVVLPTSESVVQVTLGARGMGRASETRLWIDPRTAVAIQRSQLRSSGHKHRRKTMRFTDKGVEVVSTRPVGREEPAMPESWTGRKQRFEAFPSWIADDMEVSEPTALFYLLAAAELDETGDRVELPILSDNELIMVDLVVSGEENLEVDYVRVTSRGEEVIEGAVPVLRIRASGRRLDPTARSANLEFMGMKGEIDIYLDPLTRAILQVSGRVPVAGRAHARIRRLTVDQHQSVVSSRQ